MRAVLMWVVTFYGLLVFSALLAAIWGPLGWVVLAGCTGLVVYEIIAARRLHEEHRHGTE
jgi:hypothetical protein